MRSAGSFFAPVVVIAFCGCTDAPEPRSEPIDGGSRAPDAAAEAEAVPSHVTLDSAGDPYDGHAPSQPVGTGRGLFLGDELNRNQQASNPSNGGKGWGLRMFVTFQHGATLPAGARVLSAKLVAVQSSVQGDPYAGLGGNVRVDHIDYGTLDPEDYDRAPISADVGVLSAEKTTGKTNGRRELDVTDAVAADLASARSRTQFRFRFEKQSDDDSSTDLAVFSPSSDVNSNAAGTMTLEIDFVASSAE